MQLLPLLPHHQAELQTGSGLKDPAKLGYHSTTAAENKVYLGGRDVGPGWAITYRSLNGQLKFTRVKPDQPPLDKNGKSAKYLTCKNAGNRVYISQLILDKVLGDPDVPLWVTEGEKKSDAASQAGFYCVGLAGVWCFLSKRDGQSRVIDDFKYITWQGRTVYICFDSDAATNKDVHLAEYRLAQELERFGAIVRIVRLPAAGDDKVGLDDFLLSKGRKALEALMKKSQPAEKPNKKERPDALPVRLVKLALAETELFHDKANVPYARVINSDHWETWRCNSRSFKRWLSRQFYEVEGKAAGAAAVADALNIIEAQACFEGEEHELHNRIAERDGAVWYDLTDSRWRAVRVEPGRWEIIAEPPILFIRYDHQSEQVSPIPGGDVNRLFDFIAVGDKQDQLLLKIWLVACLLPNIPHPVPVLHGPQGSGKSSAFRYLRRLIDPSVIETLSFPRDNNELVQKLSHNWMALFDNVDQLHQWQSDALCRAVTGEGFSKRQLFTDDEDVIYRFRRCIGLNGINVSATRADLLDRSILIGLERIIPTQRKEERQLESDFTEARPHILGGLFDALAEAMRLEPAVQLTGLPRMADFARWGCAIAEALGHKSADFMAAYEVNQAQQNAEVLEGEPVAAAICALMEGAPAWSGTAAELLEALTQAAEAQKINTQARNWPQAAHALTRRLNKVKPNLAAAGIEMATGRDTKGSKIIDLTYRSDNSDNSDNPLPPNDLDLDATLSLLNSVDASSDKSKSSDKVANNTKSNKNNTLDAIDAIDAKIEPYSETELKDIEL